MVSSSDDVLDVIREQRRAYAPFTPLTEDEVKRAVHAIQDAIGEWGSDRLHAQWARLVLANTERNVRAVAAGAGDQQVHSADCNVTMGRRSADHRIHCDCTVAAGDRPPAPSDVLLAALEAHRRYHRTLCGGDDDCYVCQAEDTLRAVRPPPRAAIEMAQRHLCDAVTSGTFAEILASCHAAARCLNEAAEGAAPPIDAILKDEAVRDAFVDCYTYQDIVANERKNVAPDDLEEWDRVESVLVRAILRAASPAAAPPQEGQ